MMDVYGDVASGLKECLSNMGPWSLGDLTLGIRHVGKRHDRQDISDRLPGPHLEGSTSGSTYTYLRREIKFTQAAYSIPDAATIVAQSGLPDEDCVLHVSIETAKFQPAFMLIKDSEDKLIRVVVRGTAELNDVLTDMAGVAVAIEGGSAHEGMLQAANWLLDEVLPLLEQLPRAELAGYGLRFSGHSLGAGTAALATYLLQTQAQPHAAAYASVKPLFPLARLSCFCASPPPVLSLGLARATQAYMTTCVVDHDVVSRASLANFEQLRLEVLSSGWWNELVDPVVKSSAFEKVIGTLEAAGAHQLVGLVSWDEDKGAGAGTATGAAAAPPAGTSRALDATPGGDVKYALDNLHQLLLKPTTQQRATTKADTSDKIKALVDSYMETSRKQSAEYGEKLLSKASALSKRPKQELAAVAAASVSAAAVAWFASAPASKPKTKEHEPASRSGAQASAGTSSGAHTGGGAGAAPEGDKKQGSWVSTFQWAAQAAAAAYAAGSAAKATVSAAGDVAHMLETAGHSKHKPAAAPSASSAAAAAAAQFGAADGTRTAAPLKQPSHPIGTVVDGPTDLSNLDESISSVRLYAPGQLHHLQRTTPTPEVEEEAEEEEGGADEDAEKQDTSQTSGMLGLFKKKSGKQKVKKDPEQFKLVRGEPPEARFEFIAVRKTWISDHFLSPMLQALESAEKCEPVL